MCGSRKYPYPAQGGLLKIPGGRGVSKAKILKEKYKPKLEFPQGLRGLGGQTKKIEGVWKFSKATQWKK